MIARILGIDGGLAALGWAVLSIDAGRIVDTGLVETKKESKKRKLHVGSDDARRIEAIVDELERAADLFLPVAIAYELPSAAKGARAGHALGIAHGIVRTWGRLRKMPLVEVTVLDARRAATQRPTGKVTEDDAHAAIRSRFSGLASCAVDLDHVSAHELDAIAVALAALETGVLQALRGRAA